LCERLGGPLIQFARWVGADVRELIWVSLFVRERVIREDLVEGDGDGTVFFWPRVMGRLVIFAAPGVVVWVCVWRVRVLM
jgi:hypothetical protein